MSLNFFDPKDRYFIIDSEKLNEVKPSLYGYCLVDGVLIAGYEELQGRMPDGTGAYVLIQCSDDTITLTHDSLGSYGLFLYENENNWVLSNNFQYLVDYIKPQCILTLNRDYADAFLLESLCSHVYGETMINQITWIDRSATVTIDISNKSLSSEINLKPIKFIPVDSPEGLNRLDLWYDKWVSIINRLNNECPGQLRITLSGGKDSRMVMSLFLNPSIDLSKIWIHSSTDVKDPILREDYLIASEIAKEYGFTLNGHPNSSVQERNYSLRDLVSYTSYQCLGVHKQLKVFSVVASNPIVISFGGNMGELIRGWGKNGSTSDIIQRIKKRGEKQANGEMKDCVSGAVSVIQRSIDRINSLYAKETSAELGALGNQPFFLETRWRNHFGQPGKIISHIYLSPLFDPLLMEIKEEGDSYDDPNLLAAIIYTRYGNDLSAFPIEGSRRISEKTIEYAKEINRKHPYKAPKEVSYERLPNAPHYFDPLGGDKTLWNIPVNQPKVRPEEFTEIFNRAFLSPTVKKLFLSIYKESLYEGVKNNIDFNSRYPFSTCHAVVAVAKAVYDVSCSDSNEELCDTPDFVFKCAEEVSHDEYMKYLKKQLRHSKLINIKNMMKKVAKRSIKKFLKIIK